jgi:hypothetical protein
MAIATNTLHARTYQVVKPSQVKESGALGDIETNSSNILNNRTLFKKELQEMHKDPLQENPISFLGSKWTEYGLFGAIIVFFGLLLGAQHFVSKYKDR